MDIDDGNLSIIKIGNICFVRTSKCFTNSATMIEYKIPDGFEILNPNFGRQIIQVVRESDGVSCGGVWVYNKVFSIYKDTTSQFNIIGSYIIA